MKLDEVQKAALLTIKYFDLFDYPPDNKQVHKYLYRQKTYIKETNQALFELKKLGLIDRNNRYWFLTGRKGLIEKRKKNEEHSKKLIFKLYWLGWLFKLVPFIRTVLISNNLAFNNAGETSDIDLVILTRKNRLWTARFFTALIVNLTGLRVMSKEGDPGQFCLSFFIDESKLNLLPIDKNYQLFRSYWIALLKPFYDHGLFSKFLKANSWATKNFPNLNKSWQKGPQKALSIFAFLAEKILELLPNSEEWFYNFQKNKVKKPKEKQIKKEVIINSSIFKSHFNNHREEATEILEKFLVKYR
jgi:hypothetical protein